MLSRTIKLTTTVVAGLALAGSASSAFAFPRHFHGGVGGYRHHGINGGALAAGAALGILGGAVAGAAANNYYNGYPAYSYGPGYGARYGYDYHPGYGYYGPY